MINTVSTASGRCVHRIRGDPKKGATEHSQKRPREITFWWELKNLVIKIAVIAIIFVLIFTFFYGLHRSEEPDMFPMIKDGDLIMFYRLDKNYAIGDILVLKYRGEYQTRRVVAKTGDIVDVTESGLSVNGVIQHEPEIYQQTSRYENDISFPLTVGENQFFVLGDARENATDSRVYGPVDARDTLGKVITVISRRNL